MAQTRARMPNLMVQFCTCRYQQCIEAWEVAGSGSVSACNTVEEAEEAELDGGPQAIERAKALVRHINHFHK